MHIASLILGIIAIITCLIPFFNVAVSLIALIIAIAAMCIKRPDNSGKGMKIAGLVLGIISFIISLVITGGIVYSAKYIADKNEEIKQNVQEAIKESDLSTAKHAVTLAYAEGLSNGLELGITDGLAYAENGDILTLEYYYNVLLEAGLGQTLEEIKAKYIVSVTIEGGAPIVTENTGTNTTVTDKDNSKDEVVNNEVNNADKNELTATELQKIEEFINKPENNPFAIKTYSNPADFFNNKNEMDTRYYLKYAFCLSDYATQYVMKEGEQGPPRYEITLENASEFLQSRMNYTYSDNTISEAMNVYDIGNNTYRIVMSDSSFCELDVVSGYKYDNKIYVETSSDFTITLTEQNGNYYFYASEGLDW